MINIYSKNGCSSCLQAKAECEAKGLKYHYLTLGKDYDLEKFMSFNSSHRSFPLITRYVSYDGVEMEEYVGGLAELKLYLNT